MLPADVALAGTLVSAVATPSGSTFVVDLYAYGGVGGGSMALLTTIPMNPNIPGIFGPLNWHSPLPGGSPSTFRIFVHDQTGYYSGASDIFTMQPGASIAYNSLFNPGGTTLSTWAAGTVAVPGGFGAICVCPIPEPSSMALAGP